MTFVNVVPKVSQLCNPNMCGINSALSLCNLWLSNESIHWRLRLGSMDSESVTPLLVRLWQCRCKGMRSSAKETQLVLQVSACIWVLQKVVTHQEIKTNCMCAFQFRNRIIIWLGIKVPIRRLIVSDKNSGSDSTLVSISAIIISGTMAPPSTHPTLLNWRSTIRLARQIIIRKKYLSPFKWIPSKTDLTELPTNKVKRRKRREDERRRLWGIN